MYYVGYVEVFIVVMDLCVVCFGVGDCVVYDELFLYGLLLLWLLCDLLEFV